MDPLTFLGYIQFWVFSEVEFIGSILKLLHTSHSQVCTSEPDISDFRPTLVCCCLPDMSAWILNIKPNSSLLPHASFSFMGLISPGHPDSNLSFRFFELHNNHRTISFTSTGVSRRSCLLMSSATSLRQVRIAFYLNNCGSF